MIPGYAWYICAPEPPILCCDVMIPTIWSTWCAAVLIKNGKTLRREITAR